MNGPFSTAQPVSATKLPAGFDVLSPPPLLLPGESGEQYEALRGAIFADLAPRSAIEWLLAIDVAELSWEIQRYRFLRHKLLEAYRHKAVEAALRRIDLVGITPDFEGDAEYYTAQNALTWRVDPMAATEIEHRLASAGFDQNALNAEVSIQVRDIFVLFESLLNAAQARRLLVLKEIDRIRFAGVHNARTLKRAASAGQSYNQGSRAATLAIAPSTPTRTPGRRA